MLHKAKRVILTNSWRTRNRTCIFEDHRKINITQYISNYHLFLIDFDLLEKAYKLRKYILSLTSHYIKHQVFIKNNEYTKHIYNQELNKFKLFYEHNTEFIINNLEKK